MKKILATIVLLAYFAVSSGIVVSLHYCMDRFDSASIGGSNEDKCDKCGMHKDGGCCKDEVMVVKLETSHLPSQVVIPDFSLAVLPTPTNQFFISPFINIVPEHSTVAYSPPLSEQDTYLTNCVFRI